MSQKPQISVVMPVYNQEKYVFAAMQSILRQSYRDFEFIVIDDGSTDNTLAILKFFAAVDSRIRLLTRDHQGFLSALNAGLQEAKGKWIARMDSDDICHPRRLERQVDFLERHPDCYFVSSYYGIITPNEHFLSPYSDFQPHFLTAKAITLALYPFCDPATVFDREKALLVSYDAAWENEKPLWYRLLNLGQGVVLGEPLYYVRWLVGSHSRGGADRRREVNLSIRNKYDSESAKDLNSSNRRRNKTGNLARKAAKFYLAADDFAAARTVALNFLLKCPFSPDAWKLTIRSFAKINSDVKENLKISKFSFTKVSSPW